MEVNKKELKEQEIRTLFITPALQQKGWAVSVNMREEYYFTDGRVLVVGNQHSVAEGKKADYLLYHKGKPIAVVEAKDNKHAVGGGIQQAMDYAQILDLKFAYSSNGDAFLEHDFITGKETEIKLEDFPTEEELYNRYLASKNYTSDELNIIETPFYYDAHSHEPRYEGFDVIGTCPGIHFAADVGFLLNVDLGVTGDTCREGFFLQAG